MKINIKGFPWVGAIVSVLLCAILIVLNFQAWQNQKQFGLKNKRSGLVAQMLLKLTAASEAEKSAVLAVTDKDSAFFAGQSRAATLELERERGELTALMSKAENKHEKNLLDQFSKAFAGLKQIDNDLLALAVKNTNLKAYDLAFGPAADTLKDMYSSLSKLAENNAGSPDAGKVLPLAFGAQTAALRLQTMLAPHIAAESGKKMDELEALMDKDDREVRKSLAGLASFPALRDDPDYKRAVSDFERFTGIRERIITLSRENTNVLSLAGSLGRKRKVFLQCQDLLSALQQAIQEESNAGIDSEPVPNPRSPD